MLYNINNVMTTSPTVKKDLTMRHSSQTVSYVNELVSQYAKYDRSIDDYSIDMDEISDFELHHLAALIMSDDESYANESTGADNAAYEKVMLPSLIRFLKNSTDRDEEIEFVHSWRDGVVSYYKQTMQDLLEDACGQKIYDEREEHGIYASNDPINGERVWSKHV